MSFNKEIMEEDSVATVQGCWNQTLIFPLYIISLSFNIKNQLGRRLSIFFNAVFLARRFARSHSRLFFRKAAFTVFITVAICYSTFFIGSFTEGSTKTLNFFSFSRVDICLEKSSIKRRRSSKLCFCSSIAFINSSLASVYLPLNLLAYSSCWWKSSSWAVEQVSTFVASAFAF